MSQSTSTPPTVKTFDCLVLGGGVMGAATAYALARRGHHVALLERFDLGHTRGSSHGDGRIIRYTYAEPEYVKMAGLAYNGWRQLEEESGTPLTSTTGGWECGPADSPELADLEASFRRFKIPYERWDAAESARHMPHFRLPEGSFALYQKDGGIVRAEQAVATFWQAARRHGAEIFPGVAAARIEPGIQAVTVVDEAGQHWQGQTLVMACGSWLGPLAAGLGLNLPLTVTRERVAYFMPRPDSPLDHGIGGMPTVIDYHTPQPFYALPQVDLPGVKLGWHHSGAKVTADLPRDVTAALSDDDESTHDVAHDQWLASGQQRYVEDRFVGLLSEPHHVLHCLYTNTPDYHFLLDRHPRWPQIVLAGGFSGHGFKFAPVVGSMVADLILDTPPPVDMKLFSLQRFASNPPIRRGA